jgi:hypothetical protein
VLDLWSRKIIQAIDQHVGAGGNGK